MKVAVSPLFRRIFNNSFTREFTEGFMDPDDYLELKLKEICTGCPLGPDQNGNGRSVDSPAGVKALDECRKQYFGRLLQSFVGRPGEDETEKLYSLLKKCEECLKTGIEENSRPGNTSHKTDKNIKKESVTAKNL